MAELEAMRKAQAWSLRRIAEEFGKYRAREALQLAQQEATRQGRELPPTQASVEGPEAQIVEVSDSDEAVEDYKEDAAYEDIEDMYA